MRECKLNKGIANAKTLIYFPGGYGVNDSKIHPILQRNLNLAIQNNYKIYIADYEGEGVFNTSSNSPKQILKLAAFCQEIYEKNNTPLLLFGHSRGADTALLVAQKMEDFKIFGVIACGGGYDLKTIQHFRPEFFNHFKKLFEVSEQNLNERSISKQDLTGLLNKNILLIHGKKDGRSDFKNTQKLYEKLKSLGAKNTKCILYENGKHIIDKDFVKIFERELCN